jgi:LysM repeat protein
MHRVAAGETLASIARQYGMSAASIAAANGLQSDSANAGERLLIPAAYRSSSNPARRITPAQHSKTTHRHAAVVTRTATNRTLRATGGE